MNIMFLHKGREGSLNSCVIACQRPSRAESARDVRPEAAVSATNGSRVLGLTVKRVVPWKRVPLSATVVLRY